MGGKAHKRHRSGNRHAALCVDLRGNQEDVTDDGSQKKVPRAPQTQSRHYLINRDFPQKIEVREHLASAKHD